jgi:ketosteroid isomerase-like protein
MNRMSSVSTQSTRPHTLERPPHLSLRAVRATIIFLASCAIAATAAVPQASTIVTLAKIRDNWVTNLRNKQLDPILDCYASDAVFLQPNGDRIAGSAAIRTLFQNIMATFNSDLTVHSQQLETSGDMAYDSGTFEETRTNISTGAKVNSKGSYLVVFKHQPNGAWQIVQHAWTGNPPGM